MACRAKRLLIALRAVMRGFIHLFYSSQPRYNLGHMFQLSTIWFEGRSPHGEYRVVDVFYNRRPARLLYGGGDSPQSALAFDDSAEMIFNYNQRFMEIAQSLDPKHILVIGGGAFTLPPALLKRFPDARSEAVVIDELLVNPSNRCCGLKDDPRLMVVVGDGRAYLEQTNNQYDLVVVDA